MVLLQLNSSSPSWFMITNKVHLLVLIPSSSSHHLLYKPPKFKNLSIKCQELSSTTSNSSQTTESISTVTPPNKTSSSSSAAGNGIGFGTSSNSTNAAKGKTPQFVSKKKLKGKKDNGMAAKPNFVSKKEEDVVLQVKERSQNERAFPFLVGWIVFGALIILEGILLAFSSGFLPKEWDKFLMKYLYPTFTPTVFIFVVRTAAYGVLKYIKYGKPPKIDG